MLKHLLIACFPFLATAQSFEGTWSEYFSYYRITDVAVGNNKVYAAAENAFFIYDPVSGDMEKISSVNGLSGESISAIHYSEGSNKLFIGYLTGLLEIYDFATNKVLTIGDIVEKQTIPANTKGINHFMEHNGLLYISCGFGITTFRIVNSEFGDTFFIGDGGALTNVRQTTVYQDYVYAATDTGVCRALVANPNLIDFNEWETINPSNWTGIQAFAGGLYAIRNDNRLFSYDGVDFMQTVIYPATVNDFKANENHLVVTLQTGARIYDTNLSEIANISNFTGYTGITYTTAIARDDAVFLGTQLYGVLQTQLSAPSTVSEIHPQGPLLNSAFAIKSVPGNELWVVFGDYDVFLNPYPLDSRGISHLRANSWVNIPFSNLFNARSLVHVTPNPSNPQQVFISSFFSGLLRVDNDVPTILYNQANSGLESLDTGDPTYIDVRIGGTTYDNSGNLWILNTKVENALKVLTPSGEWLSYSITDLIPDPFNQDPGFKELVIDKNQYKFFTSYSNGLIGFYENDGNSLIRNINQENNLPDNDVTALAIDKNNQLWIGTLKGLRVLYNTDTFFSGNPSAESIIILDNGVPSELLFEQFITDIFVDGDNNKWIATADSGVFYVSSDGSKTLYHLTQDNSPLPSNTVNQVEVDTETGRVYFATPRGVVSFLGNAREPKENLQNVYAYPNPVRPGYSGEVTITGLVRNANVKITDIEGNLVHEAVSQGGSLQWNLTAFNRHKVASGVYLVLISNEDASETAVSKIMVVR